MRQAIWMAADFSTRMLIYVLLPFGALGLVASGGLSLFEGDDWLGLILIFLGGAVAGLSYVMIKLHDQGRFDKHVDAIAQRMGDLFNA